MSVPTVRAASDAQIWKEAVTLSSPPLFNEFDNPVAYNSPLHRRWPAARSSSAGAMHRVSSFPTPGVSVNASALGFRQQEYLKAAALVERRARRVRLVITCSTALSVLVFAAACFVEVALLYTQSFPLYKNVPTTAPFTSNPTVSLNARRDVDAQQHENVDGGRRTSFSKQKMALGDWSSGIDQESFARWHQYRLAVWGARILVTDGLFVAAAATLTAFMWLVLRDENALSLLLTSVPLQFHILTIHLKLHLNLNLNPLSICSPHQILKHLGSLRRA